MRLRKSRGIEIAGTDIDNFQGRGMLRMLVLIGLHFSYGMLNGIPVLDRVACNKTNLVIGDTAKRFTLLACI
jgi:hypothetical protein